VNDGLEQVKTRKVSEPGNSSSLIMKLFVMYRAALASIGGYDSTVS
jgi:hypothetical protein